MEWNKVDWDRVCPGCIRELSKEAFESTYCPYCGFAKSGEDRTNALPVNTILNGKYILGKILARTEEEITYLAYDLNLEIKIQISEYFPVEVAKRAENGRLAEPQSGQETAFGEGLTGYKEKAKVLVRANTVTGDESSIREVFQENGTVYRVLLALPEEADDGTTAGSTAAEPGEEAGATVMPGADESVQQSVMPETQAVKNPKKKWMFFAVIAAAVVLLAVGITVAVVLSRKDDRQTASGKLDDTKVNGNGATQTQGLAENRSSLLGAYYEPENVVCFPALSTIYFGYPGEDGKLQNITALTSFADESVMIAAIAVDDGYLYVLCVGEDETSYGIFRTPIQTSEVEFTAVTQRGVWSDFVFYDKYIYYAANNVLYRALKDGSSEIVLNSHASDQFVIYEDRIFFYSEEDGYIHKMKTDGSDEQVWLDADDVGCMAAAEGYLFVTSGGMLYQVDIKTGNPVDENGIAETIDYSDILIYGNRVYCASTYATQIYGYDISTKEKVTVYNGEPYAMVNILAGRMYVADMNGDYFSTSLDGMDMKDLGFNYFTAAEIYGK